MSTKELSVQFLREFGLKEKEIEIYFFLMQNGPQRALTISRNLKMHKMQVYRYLESMERKGAVVLTFEAPRCFGVSPINTLLNRRAEDLKLSLKFLEKSKEKIVNCQKTFAKDKSLKLPEEYAIMQGTERIGLAILDLVKRANKEICVLIPSEPLFKFYNCKIDDFSFRHKPTFTYRCLTQVSSNKVLDAEGFLKSISNRKYAEARHTDTQLDPFPCFLIKDGKETVLITTSFETKDELSAVWTNNKIVVGLIRKLFEELWQKSKQVQTILPPIT